MTIVVIDVVIITDLLTPHLVKLGEYRHFDLEAFQRAGKGVKSSSAK